MASGVRSLHCRRSPRQNHRQPLHDQNTLLAVNTACRTVVLDRLSEEAEHPMPTMTVDHDYFTNHAEVMADIARTGYWPTTFISDASPELPVHYHDQDIIGYVMSGSTYLLTEDGERIEIKAGDRLNIPRGAWHAEGQVTDQVSYIVTTGQCMPFLEALMPREPKGPWPDL